MLAELQQYGYYSLPYTVRHDQIIRSGDGLTVRKCQDAHIVARQMNEDFLKFLKERCYVTTSCPHSGW